MKQLPKIDLRPTPQDSADRRRTELLMEIEEDQQEVPDRIRQLIVQQISMDGLKAVIDRINRAYAEGGMSDKLLKRCGTWVSRRMEELRTPKETH